MINVKEVYTLQKGVEELRKDFESILKPKVYSISAQGWSAPNNEGVRSYSLVHNKNLLLEEIDIKCFLGNESVVIGYEFIDINTIKLYSDEAIMVKVVLGTPASSIDIKSNCDLDSDIELIKKELENARGEYASVGARIHKAEVALSSKSDKDTTYTKEQVDEIIKTIELTKGDKGDKGDDGLDGKDGVRGENGLDGKAFTYDDFTPSQLLSLKGEKGDKGDRGERGPSGSNANIDLTPYETTMSVDAKLLSKANVYNVYSKEEVFTKEEVDKKIKEASLGGETDVADLSNYYTKPEIDFMTGVKANEDHTHSSYSGITHTHRDLADKDHAHSEYATLHLLDKKADKTRVYTKEEVDDVISNIELNPGQKGDKGDPFTYEDFTQEQLSSLKGERGEVGPVGAKGDIGERGVAGERGRDGANGLDGKDGESAFAIAVSNGYIGTEEDWILSLKGDRGPRGERGVDGERGAKGDKGDKGEIGLKGDKGDPFTYEDFTLSQLESLKGAKGDVGATGPKGEPGVDGKDGMDGTDANVDLTPYATNSSVDSKLTLKANKGDVYSKTETFTKEEVSSKIAEASLGGEVDLSSYYTKSQTDTLVDAKADKSHSHSEYANSSHSHNEYAQASQLSLKADKSTTYTKAEVDTAIGNVTVDLSDYSTTQQMNTAISSATSSKVDKVTGKSLSSNDFTNELKSKVLDTYSKTQVYTKAETYSKSQVDTAIGNIPTVDLTPYATKTELGSKIEEAKTYADNSVAGILDSAPETLNTLNELANALGDDPNFATTVTNMIGIKADKSHSHTEFNSKVDKVSGKQLSTNDYTNDHKSKVETITSLATKTELSSGLASKANSSHTHSNYASSSDLNLKADKTTTYTKSEVDAAVKSIEIPSEVFVSNSESNAPTGEETIWIVDDGESPSSKEDFGYIFSSKSTLPIAGLPEQDGFVFLNPSTSSTRVMSMIPKGHIKKLNPTYTDSYVEVYYSKIYRYVNNEWKEDLIHDYITVNGNTYTGITNVEEDMSKFKAIKRDHLIKFVTLPGNIPLSKKNIQFPKNGIGIAMYNPTNERFFFIDKESISKIDIEKKTILLDKSSPIYWELYSISGTAWASIQIDGETPKFDIDMMTDIKTNMWEVYHELKRIYSDTKCFYSTDAESSSLQQARGNSLAVGSYIGKEGQIVIDTEKLELRVMDGATPGGKIIGEQKQEMPSEALDSASGWYYLPNGHLVQYGMSALSGGTTTAVSLYKKYNSTTYSILLTGMPSSNSFMLGVDSLSDARFIVSSYSANSAFWWQTIGVEKK